MTYLGIDIGLKNLAMCITDSDNNILMWNVYNIIDEQYICSVCIRKAKCSSSGIFYCGLHSRKIKTKGILKNKKISSYSLQELASKIIKKFREIIVDNIDSMNIVTNVIIELQPSINPKMKFTSHVMFTLLTDFYTDKKCSIKFERASVKLKKYKSVVYIKNTYTNRKKRAIEYTKIIVENHIKNPQEYISLLYSKKADDLCDAFLLSYRVKK